MLMLKGLICVHLSECWHLSHHSVFGSDALWDFSGHIVFFIYMCACTTQQCTNTDHDFCEPIRHNLRRRISAIVGDWVCEWLRCRCWRGTEPQHVASNIGAYTFYHIHMLKCYVNWIKVSRHACDTFNSIKCTFDCTTASGIVSIVATAATAISATLGCWCCWVSLPPLCDGVFGLQTQWHTTNTTDASDRIVHNGGGVWLIRRMFSDVCFLWFCVHKCSYTEKHVWKLFVAVRVLKI